MTLSEIIRDVGEFGVRRSELDSEYRRIVLRAIRNIHLRRNWTWLRTTLTATIAVGNSSATLTGYKGLDNEADAAVTVADGNGNYVPVNVLDQGEIETLNVIGYNLSYGTYAAVNGAYEPVYIVTNATGATINTLAVLTTARSYKVKCFAVPADLTPTTSNTLTEEHPDMVIAHAKQLCWEMLSGSPNVPEAPQSAVMCAQLYESHYQKAASRDALKRLNNQPVRM